MATKKEHQERIDAVVHLMSLGWKRSEIKRTIKGRFGVSRATADRYMSRARERLLQETGKPKEEHIAESYAFYCSMKRETGKSDKDRLHAQERIDKLLGLESHTKSLSVGLSVTPEEIDKMTDGELDHYIATMQQAFQNQQS